MPQSGLLCTVLTQDRLADLHQDDTIFCIVEMIVLYNKPNFGGSPKVINTDIADLKTVDFNNKAMSFKIYGGLMFRIHLRDRM